MMMKVVGLCYCAVRGLIANDARGRTYNYVSYSSLLARTLFSLQNQNLKSIPQRFYIILIIIVKEEKIRRMNLPYGNTMHAV
jgi:hypothetical protein